MKLKLAGMIYVHRISDNRMILPSLSDFNMFASMCGQHPMPNIVLATTCWSEVKEPSRAEQRESELHMTHWKEMLDNGTTSMRFDETFESAWAIADSILEKDACKSLDFQVKVEAYSRNHRETYW
jgi:hypothetical protein